MKVLLSTTFVLGASAAVLPDLLNALSGYGFLLGYLANGNVITPNGIAPPLQNLKVRTRLPESKRVKLRYGPYKMPSSNATSEAFDPFSASIAGMSGEKGMVSLTATNMSTPCEECGLTMLQAGLEYADGTQATTGTGAWLHHVLLLAQGPGRQDTVCANDANWTTFGQRIFSSGNERTAASFTDMTYKTPSSAFQINKGDSLAMQLELMNLNPQPQEVYFTLDFEFLPGPRRRDVETATALWLDVTGCGNSNVKLPKGQPASTFSSSGWTAPFSGRMLAAAGHLHDGGTEVKMFKNSQLVCDSKATYGMTNGGAAKPMEPGAAHGESTEAESAHRGHEKIRRDEMDPNMPHIATMSGCASFGIFKRGDTFHIEASYDVGKWMPMEAASGEASTVMGIAVMNVVED
ncbi:hypothetical protein K402DRAFT_468002 [Aulographum hederae CBS 113979]|uniref:Uncharacterized protein n=1 Tax=Aulographum hederae CBS 113979 TaxID=1176131 RepID=A0A6G1GJ10_9PEZI|nr:hypothetical protein K402DRAFT_468002 [Aulographum hederae CBS 113979]